MKHSFKRVSAGLMALFMVLSLVFTIIPSDSFAATITYSKTSNSGTRDEICTTLDGTGAEDYYTSSYTFDVLSEQSSSQLMQSLRTLMTSTHKKTTSYNNCRDYANRTDCENEDGRVLLLYTSYSATMSQYNGWNREHVWPQSLGGNNTSGGGADLHHIRPSDAVVNSTRGNKKYGNADGGTAVYGKTPATGYLGGHYSGNYYEPLDNVKGDVARICLYVYVRWGTAWGADSITEVFQSVDILLEWMELDPVDTWEMGRNEVVENIQGNRNVFIDYPEYAWLMFGRDVPEGITTPSDNDGVTANPGGSNSGNNGGSSSTPDTSYTQVSSLNDGDKVVIVNPASNMALSTAKVATYYNAGVDISGGFSSISNSEIFTAKKNSDGSWSFTSADGKKLALADSYNSLNDTGANDKWELTNAGTKQFYLKNIARDLYLEWYADKNNWSTHNSDSLNQDYILAFYTKATSSGNNGNSGSSSSGNSGNSGNSGSTTTTKPATQPATKPATQPSTQATQPSTTTPSTSATNPITNTQPSSTGSAAPQPLATNSVPVPTLNKGNQDSNPNSWILIVILVAIALIGGGVAIYFFVIRPKKATPVAKPESEEETNDSNE